MTAIIFDTETTGITNPEIIESAWMTAEFIPNNPSTPQLHFSVATTQRFKPQKKISMGAMATHHIMDEDLENCPPSTSFVIPSTVKYLIGHNVDYDWNVAGSPHGMKRIDTLCLARKYLPDCDSHSLSALTYYLFRHSARVDLRSAHSAEADIKLTGNLLNSILMHVNAKIDNFEDLWALSESARVPEIMPFGKHKGEKISSMPVSYKSWLLSQPDVDPYLAVALRN